MPFTDLTYEKRDRIAIASFARPERLNAIRGTTRRELLEILRDAAEDDAVRSLVLTGKGRAFCAGVDLKEFGEILTEGLSLKASRDSLVESQELTRLMVNHPKPIIAAVNGVAVGYGAELAVASDVRVVGASASFGFPEARRALFVTNGVLYLLPRIIGFGRALEMVMTSRMMLAEEALATGLATRLVPDDQLLETAIGIAQALAANGPISVRLLKRYMHRALDLDIEAAMVLEMDAYMECASHADMMEGTRAFLEKREANYEGR